jgi:hypothetical protein
MTRSTLTRISTLCVLFAAASAAAGEGGPADAEDPPAGFERFHSEIVERMWVPEMTAWEIEMAHQRGWRLIDVEHHRDGGRLVEDRFCCVFLANQGIYEAEWEFWPNVPDAVYDLESVAKDRNLRVIDLEYGAGGWTAVLVKNEGVQYVENWGIEHNVPVDGHLNSHLDEFYQSPIDVECGVWSEGRGKNSLLTADYVWVDRKKTMWRSFCLADKFPLENLHPALQVLDFEWTPTNWTEHEKHPFLVILGGTGNPYALFPDTDTENINFYNNVDDMTRLIDLEPYPNDRNRFSALWVNVDPKDRVTER